MADPVTTLVNAGALGVLAKQAQDFLAAASGHKGETIGTILGSVVDRRRKNAEAVSAKSHLLLLNLGLSPKEVPLNILQPTLEAASLQEEESMQDIWANLLANAADPRQERPVSAGFIQILKELAPSDAKFLDTLYAHATKEASNPAYGRPTWQIEFGHAYLLSVFEQAGLSRMDHLSAITVKAYDDNREDYDADMENFGFMLDMALRHNILAEQTKNQQVNGSNLSKMLGSSISTGITTPIKVESSIVYMFTRLGVAFMRACQQPT